MGVYTFKDLRSHVGHKIECVCYGNPVVNVAVECETCGEVLMDFDIEEEEEEDSDTLNWLEEVFNG